MSEGRGRKGSTQAKRTRWGKRSARSDALAGPLRAPTENAQPETIGGFPVVGLGASAGGLAPLGLFFEKMPADSGMAFVVVTHQHPGQASLLVELLQRRTSMPVTEVTSDTAMHANHVYAASSGTKLALVGGVLHPVSMTEGGSPHLPVDFFFRSLARERQERAIAIVLSGTGSDGSLGLTEVKAEFGLVMVQDEQTASYAGMPHSAVATDLVDYVLPVTQMPEQLLAYAKSLAIRRTQVAKTESLIQITHLIRDHLGHDFAHYKQSTVIRRVERRMHVHHFDDLSEYVRYLQANDAEVELLFRDLLIGVTSFFRDPEAWEGLADQVRELVADKPDDYVLRAWVAGCSTGEEAYSLAIMLRELTDALHRPLTIQIFATDLNPAAIEAARSGAYPFGIVNDVSSARLACYFMQEDVAYRVKKEVRETVVFAPQNLIADPPFTKIDLLCCRNVLIYMDAKLQQRLLPVLHYSLRPGGLLFLGTSESTGSCAELFSAVDKRWKIFRRNEVARGTYVTDFSGTSLELPSSPALHNAPQNFAAGSVQLEALVEEVLLKELVPPTVLVHERGDVVHVHGRTGLFLEPAQGAPSNANIFKMVKPELRANLSAALREAATSDSEVIRRGEHVKTGARSVPVDVRVRRVREPPALRGLFRITFEQVQDAHREGDGHSVGAEPPDRVTELERDLQYAKESHRGMVEELHTANEELKSTNEELQSTNEELQSANEELETSKEEMQSLNEELQTVNVELQGKVEQLSHANNDMKNLLNATNIATIFLDKQLRIKRYTERAKSIIRMIPTDIGRPLGDLAPSLDYDHLVQDAQQVLRTLEPQEIELRGGDQADYLMRILPYRTTDNVIEGIVLTFIDVSTVKKLQAEQAHLLGLLESSPVSIFGQDRELRFTWAFSSVFGVKPEQLIGKLDQELFDSQDADELSTLKQEVLSTGLPVRRRVELSVQGARRTYELYLVGERDRDSSITGLSCLVMDVTNTA